MGKNTKIEAYVSVKETLLEKEKFCSYCCETKVFFNGRWDTKCQNLTITGLNTSQDSNEGLDSTKHVRRKGDYLSDN
jgi:hypothetical protein